MGNFKLESHKDEVLRAANQQVLNALEICGGMAESRAKEYSEPIDTGRLRNSISHKVDAATQEAYIGTNVQYAPYIEFGTGQHFNGGEGGRQSVWGYEKKGKIKLTHGIRGRHYLRRSLADHIDTYKKILIDTLKGK